MKKSAIFSVLLIGVFLSALIGCDRRSQTEKDIDKAAAGAKKAAGDAQKELGF